MSVGAGCGCLCEGGENCPEYLKRGWNRKKGSRNKNFKIERQAGSRGGHLKKRGVKPPCELWTNSSWINQNNKQKAKCK